MSVQYAFPVTEDGSFIDAGMTLRDYFAASAMQGMLANSEAVHAGAEPMNSYLLKEKGREDFARSAYEMADAMLRAREVQA